MCDGFLWLNDKRKGEKPLRVRVVGRRRHRTGKIAWYATNVAGDEFSPSDVIRLYFERWPAQEHVYRDGSGLVGLDVHHGYGKKKVDNVAVLDRIEKLDGQLRSWTQRRTQLESSIEALRAEIAEWDTVIQELEPEVDEQRTTIGELLAAGEGGQEIAEYFQGYERMERWLSEARIERETRQGKLLTATKAAAKAEAALRRGEQEREELERRREIFTVDVELDEVLTAFKLTFMNLCCELMRTYLGKWMELETLIEAVLTLPGERAITATTDTVRIYRPDRAARTMDAVERACAALNALGMTRERRLLRFELVPHPSTDGG